MHIRMGLLFMHRLLRMVKSPLPIPHMNGWQPFYANGQASENGKMAIQLLALYLIFPV